MDVPLEEPRYDDKFAGDDPKKGFIVSKLIEFLNVLGNPDAPIEERRTTLRFVVHLVGDLHMSMHVGENHDKSGNTLQVRWFDRGSNPHRVWDSGMIDRAGTNENRWLYDPIAMDTPEAPHKAQGGSIEELGDGNLLAARAAYQDPATGQRIKPGTKLGDDYQARSLPVAKRRLYQAGARLARVLNEVFPE